MPSVPTYLAGVRSNKVRNLLNYFNGAAGILKLTPVGHDPSGLSFDVTTQDDPVEGLEWACKQVDMAYAPHGDGAQLSGVCQSAGNIAGHVTTDVDAAGKWVSRFRLRAGG